MITIVPGKGRLSAADEARVAETARTGGTVVFPTDTFYALGADPRSRRGVEAVFSLKKRPRTEPLLLLLDEVGRVERYAAAVSRGHRLLMGRFWPGPLTLLFPARGDLPEGVVSPAGEIALRVPGNALCRAVTAAAGGALTGTSANASGHPPPSSPADALSSLGGAPDLVVDAGTLPPAEVSTLVRLEKGGVTLLRKGAVPGAELGKVLAAEGTAPGLEGEDYG